MYNLPGAFTQVVIITTEAVGTPPTIANWERRLCAKNLKKGVDKSVFFWYNTNCSVENKSRNTKNECRCGGIGRRATLRW